MTFCGQASLLDLYDPCVRAVYRGLAPLAFILLFIIIALLPPLPTRYKLTRRIKRTLHPFLTIREAEYLLSSSNPEPTPEPPSGSSPWNPKRVALRMTIPLCLLGSIEMFVWIGLSTYSFVAGDIVVPGWTSLLVALTWAYIAFKPVIVFSPIPHYDVFVLLSVQLTNSLTTGIGRWYQSYVYAVPKPHFNEIGWWMLDFAVITGLLYVVSTSPVELPSEHVDTLKIGREVSPEDYASIWGWMTFGFVTSIIKQGTEKTLNEEDVWEVSPNHRAGPLLTRYRDVKGKTLLRKLWVVNSLDLIMDAILTLISVIFNYAGPFFLKRILDAIEHPSREARARAYVYAVLMFVSSMIKTQADMHHLWYGRQAVTRTRSLLMAAIFDKALKRKDFRGAPSANSASGGPQGKPLSIKKAALEQIGKLGKSKGKKGATGAGADIGKIVNLMSGDASKVSQIWGNLYNLYGAPLEIIVASVFLYQLLGISAFVGFIAVVALMPFNHYLSKQRIFVSRGISAARDRRMAVLNELFVAVKFIKLCAWDDRWIFRAEKARNKEIKWIKRERFNTILMAFIWTCAPILVSVVSFTVFVIQGRQLTTSIAFTSIVLFNQLRQPLSVLPNFLATLLQARVAIERLAVFFGEEEVEAFVSSLKRDQVDGSQYDGEPQLGISGHGNFVWNAVEEKPKEDKPATNSPPSSAEEPRFELKDIDIIFPSGRLTIVTGSTASGKTALLLATLGEMTTVPGSKVKIHLPKDTTGPLDERGLRNAVSFAAQTPWLEHLTIRDNILFGSPFEHERYWAVIEACALGPDLKVLEDGDQTEIGERGISLSGGQKARVALARAVYARTKFVLLDDPLSAVDSHTARFLVEKLFAGELLKGRTVVLVTHHVELVLPSAHYLVQMVEGRIDVQGSVPDLRAAGLLQGLESDSSGSSSGYSSGSESNNEPSDDKDKDKRPENDSNGKPANGDTDSKPQNAPRKLVQAEERAVGNVKWEIYDTYLKASSYLTWIVILILIIISQAFGFLEKFWLKIWGEAYGPKEHLLSMFQSSIGQLTTLHEDSIHIHEPSISPLFVNPALPEVSEAVLPSANKSPLFYVAIYAAIGFAGVIITTINTVVQYVGAVRASRLLFTRLLDRLVHATMRWHDITPTGRILNRLSRDMEVLDSSLSNSLRAVTFRLATFAASIITVAYVFPVFLIPAFFISLMYLQISRGYVSAGRDMRRMQSTTRSPIFAGFAETLEGIVTVRAFASERRFVEILVKKVDLATKMWYGWWMLNRWLLLRFDGLGALSIFVITLFALSGYVDSGWAAITITSAMQFTVSVYWTCRFATQLELDLNSVERVVEYLDLPQEPPNKLEGHEVPANWPSTSESNSFIKVEDLVIRYSPELPPVLHGVSFELRAGEKVGLLGRTGSGKSTLAMSLLRFTEPSSGKIFVGGLDICSIGLSDLRSKVTIIPQDSVLFSGSMRENLDPFEEYTDEECLDALYRVHLLTPGRPTISTGSVRIRKSSAVSPKDSDSGNKLKIVFNRDSLVPEPDSMLQSENEQDREFVKRQLFRKHHGRHLFPSETLLAPAIGHTGGTVTPVHFAGDREASLDDNDNEQQQEEEAADREGVDFRIGTVSGISSPLMRRHGQNGGLTPIPDESSEGDGGASPRSATGSANGVRTLGSGAETATTQMITLETRVASGGSNFSNGQRQLVAMARALLRRNKVVILDEATSSIDFDTDKKIQDTVRDEFRDSCLLTIAHRIKTVIDYDRLIVLDKGRIVEFDTPWNLIRKEGGIFRDMCVKSGTFRELENLAREKAEGQDW